MNEQYYLLEKELCMTQEFYGLLLMNMNKTFDRIKNNETMCVYIDNTDYKMDINSDFFRALQKLPLESRLACLQHELMHLAFFHLYAYDTYFKEDRELTNIAADLSINCYLKHLPTELDVDKNGVTEHMQFIDFEVYKVKYNLEPYKDLSYYYDKLKNAMENKRQQQNGGSTGGAGRPGDLSEFTQDHTNVKEDNMTERRMAQQNINSVMKNVINELNAIGCGNIPAGLKETLAKFEVEEPKHNWRQYLALFASKSTEYTIRKTRRKPSKRFDDACGNKKKPNCKVLALFDTSGSMGKAELNEVYSEFVYITRKHRATLDYACFDCSVYDILHMKKGDIEITGRGGTDFFVAVDKIKEVYKKYDCFIIFSDGYATMPEEVPCNVLLCLSSTSTCNPEDFHCNCIKLDKDGKA